jgi:Notch-like protein
MYNNQVINFTIKMKTTWNIIKSETSRLNGHTISKYQNCPEAFNKYFLSIAVKIIHDIRYSNIKGYSNNKDPKYYLSKLSQNPFPSIKFNNKSTKEIERIINSLKLKNSYVYDEISTKILKASAPIISSVNYICNKSIISGTFPTRLNYCIVKPLFKKGDRKNVANYTPISLLTPFSKVFEKII